MKSVAPGFFPVQGIWGARRPVDVGFARTGVKRRHSPTSSKKGVDDNRCTACENATVRTDALLANLGKYKKEERKEWRFMKTRYFDDPKDDVAFERCVDVLAELIEKYAGLFALNNIGYEYCVVLLQQR